MNITQDGDQAADPRPPRVCIVGASGKLGRYMVGHALARGYDVVGVCRERSVANLSLGRALLTKTMV